MDCINLERIKKEIGESLRNGNQTEFKKLMSLVNKVYRNLNKDKVEIWNKSYRDKVKLLKNNTSNINNMEKNNTSIEQEKAIKEKNNTSNNGFISPM